MGAGHGKKGEGKGKVMSGSGMYAGWRFSVRGNLEAGRGYTLYRKRKRRGKKALIRRRLQIADCRLLSSENSRG
jgi:hypothetical protein